MHNDYQAYIRRVTGEGTYKSTRANVLTARLRAAILRGDLEPGHKINLDRLRSEFGVSLSPLREASVGSQWMVLCMCKINAARVLRR